MINKKGAKAPFKKDLTLTLPKIMIDQLREHTIKHFWLWIWCYSKAAKGFSPGSIHKVCDRGKICRQYRYSVKDDAKTIPTL
jgi:hypothetical protein